MPKLSTSKEFYLANDASRQASGTRYLEALFAHPNLVELVDDEGKAMHGLKSVRFGEDGSISEEPGALLEINTSKDIEAFANLLVNLEGVKKCTLKCGVNTVMDEVQMVDFSCIEKMFSGVVIHDYITASLGMTCVVWNLGDIKADDVVPHVSLV